LRSEDYLLLIARFNLSKIKFNIRKITLDLQKLSKMLFIYNFFFIKIKKGMEVQDSDEEEIQSLTNGSNGK